MSPRKIEHTPGQRNLFTFEEEDRNNKCVRTDLVERYNLLTLALEADAASRKLNGFNRARPFNKRINEVYGEEGAAHIGSFEGLKAEDSVKFFDRAFGLLALEKAGYSINPMVYIGQKYDFFDRAPKTKGKNSEQRINNLIYVPRTAIIKK